LIVVAIDGLAIPPVTVTVTVVELEITPLVVPTIFVPPRPVIVTVYVLAGAEDVNVQLLVAVPPAVRVAEGQFTVRPVAGTDEAVKETAPAKPLVVPPRLATLRVVEPPALPLWKVTVSGEAERLKPLTRTTIEPVAGNEWLIPPPVALTIMINLEPEGRVDAAVKLIVEVTTPPGGGVTGFGA